MSQETFVRQCNILLAVVSYPVARLMVSHQRSSGLIELKALYAGAFSLLVDVAAVAVR